MKRRKHMHNAKEHIRMCIYLCLDLITCILQVYVYMRSVVTFMLDQTTFERTKPSNTHQPSANVYEFVCVCMYTYVCMCVCTYIYTFI